MSSPNRLWLGALLFAACGPPTKQFIDLNVEPVSVVALDPTANPDRDVIATGLTFDVTTLKATAHVTFGPTAAVGATLEVGDLVLESVRFDNADLKYLRRGALIDLALKPSTEQLTVDFTYSFKHHDSDDGAATAGFTLLWPYYCGNLFPCHSQPSDGTTFTLDVTGVPAGKTAVFPPTIAIAPAYQVAWSIDTYTELDLGQTTAGTHVSVWHRPGEAQMAQQGTAHLVAAFNWLEQTLGPYPFGTKVGSVSVDWGPSAFGGMEHHPRWHIGSVALGDEGTNVHESAHGWFGDGIRIACWEDFVLSEGTVSYLAARALEVVAPTVGAAEWSQYQTSLSHLHGTEPVWPDSCGTIDVLNDHLFSIAPYMRGAFFLRAVALKVGADVLDHALSTFFRAHVGKAAKMSELITTIGQVTGYDASACAASWLRSTTIPAIGPCP